jgi:hypothetical protein
MSHSAASSDDQQSPSGAQKPVRKAGAFDMRNFIAALIGLYGLVLVIYGIIGSSDIQLKKTGGININLWAGIGMIVVAAIFLTWARLKPVVVPAEVSGDDHG